MSDDPRTALLFQCRDSDLIAIAYDPKGANLPKNDCPG
jgi:hypothetical protein